MMKEFSANYEGKNQALYFLSLILGSSVFVFGLYYKLDSFIILVISVTFWIVSAFCKGRYSLLIIIGLFLTSLMILFVTANSLIDGFAGFFLFLFVDFLGFGAWLNNSHSKSQKTLIDELMICPNCKEKIFKGTKVCPNCNTKINNS